MMARILLVEDEEEVAESLRDIIQGQGYEVTITETAEEALKILRQERFDLAIIDLGLPRMSGSDLCAMIRHDKLLKELIIIVSTGRGDDFNRKALEEIGVDGFLSKPYTVEEFLGMIRRWL